MRDGAFVDETRLTDGTTGDFGDARRTGGLKIMGKVVLVCRLAVRDLAASPAAGRTAAGGDHRGRHHASPWASRCTG